MLIDWLGRRHSKADFTTAAHIIETSVDAVLRTPATRTIDLGGPLGTSAFTSELCKEIDGHGVR
jgi:3-isopropylmalate dehydrogenase